MATKKIASTKKSAAKKATPKKKGFIKKHIVAVGAGVAALGAATYYLFGPNGKKHQKELKGWMTKMKAEVDRSYAKTEKMTKTAYHAVVDEVAKAYAHHGKAEVAQFAKKLKSQWKSAEKSVRAPIKKAVKSVAKKVSKKK